MNDEQIDKWLDRDELREKIEAILEKNYHFHDRAKIVADEILALPIQKRRKEMNRDELRDKIKFILEERSFRRDLNRVADEILALLLEQKDEGEIVGWSNFSLEEIKEGRIKIYPDKKTANLMLNRQCTEKTYTVPIRIPTKSESPKTKIEPNCNIRRCSMYDPDCSTNCSRGNVYCEKRKTDEPLPDDVYWPEKEYVGDDKGESLTECCTEGEEKTKPSDEAGDGRTRLEWLQWLQRYCAESHLDKDWAAIDWALGEISRLKEEVENLEDQHDVVSAREYNVLVDLNKTNRAEISRLQSELESRTEIDNLRLRALNAEERAIDYKERIIDLEEALGEELNNSESLEGQIVKLEARTVALAAALSVSF